MKKPKFRRSERGFTLLETMMAGVLMLAGLTGVLLLSVYTSSNAQKSALNLEMTQYAAQVLMERTSSGVANVGINSNATNVKLPSGHLVTSQVTVTPLGGVGSTVTVTVVRTDPITSRQVRYVQSAIAINPP
ncbi:MAG: type IV pilus modification PilV family protein [Myxococcaceae bacterium]